MDLSTWIAQFDREHWELLRTTAAALPPPLRGALLCRVSNVTLPLDLVLEEASRIAPMAGADTRRSVVYLPQPPVEVVVPHTRPEDHTPLEPAVSLEPLVEPHTRGRAGRPRAEPDEEQPRQRRRADSPTIRDGPARSRSPLRGGNRTAKACPLCLEVPTHMRRHVESCHLPFYFHGDAACFRCNSVLETASERAQHTAGHGSGPASIDEIDGTAYRIWVWSMANLLQEISLATGTGQLEDLPAVFKEHGWCPPQNCGIQFNLAMESMLRDVALVIGQPRPWEPLEVGNPRNPVDILHWRTMLRFLCDLNEATRERIRLLNPAVVPHTARRTLGHASSMDSHCHLATMLRREGRGAQASLEAAYTATAEQMGDLRSHCTPRLSALVDNRTFKAERQLPTTSGIHYVKLPEDLLGAVRVVCTYGVHPTEREQPNWREFEQLARSEDCVAIGECGLDHTSGRDQRRRQAGLLRRQVQLALLLEKPIVLHLRPSGQSATKVLQEAREILGELRVPRSQPIHLHSFVGSIGDYRTWLARFPNTVFGVSHATLRTNHSDDLLRLADLRRLVLESDAPFMSRDDRLPNTPYGLHPQADRIARLRGLPTRSVLQATCLNARQFYGL